VATPMEKVLAEIAGVNAHLFRLAPRCRSADRAVRRSAEDRTSAIVRLYNAI